MPHRPSRRDAICDTALTLAAEGGNRALTHQAVDAHLGLSPGSTSYYYRTRYALVSAAITRLTTRSRDDFEASTPPDLDASVAVTVVTGYLCRLVTDRRVDVRARFALLTDAARDDDLHRALTDCLFSYPAATRLMTALGAPEATAQELISFLEGLAFTYTVGARRDSTDAPRELEASIGRWMYSVAA